MFKMTTVSVNAQFKTFDASFDHSSALFNQNCLGVSSNRIFHASSIMVIFCHHLLFKMSPQVKIKNLVGSNPDCLRPMGAWSCD